MAVFPIDPSLELLDLTDAMIRSREATGRRCVLAAAVLWSLSGVVTKGLPLEALPIAFYRSLFAGLALMPLIRPSRWVVRPGMLAGGLVFAAMIGLYIASVKATTAANAIFLQYTALIWTVPAGALFLREKPDRRTIAGSLLAMGGIATIVLEGYEPGQGQGVAMGLASGVCYALVVIGMRHRRDLDPLWLSAFNNLVGALALGAWMATVSGPFPMPTALQVIALTAFGVVQMAIPYALFARGLKDVPAAEAGLIGLVEPVLNPVWVALVHREYPAPATIVGGSLLLAGVATRYLPSRRVTYKNPRDIDNSPANHSEP